MAKTSHYYVKFLPDCHYHVYNRAVDKKNMFLSDDNYAFFLKQYDKYLSPVVTTFSYALLGNHFHFTIRVHAEEVLFAFQRSSKLNPERYNTPHAIVAHQFQLFFQSYAMAFNLKHGRTGTLFQRPFKRCNVDPDHLPRLIMYHHLNPQRHRMIKDFRQYPWTSYSRYLSDHPSKLPRQEVFELFGGREEFIKMHQSTKDELDDEAWVIEE